MFLYTCGKRCDAIRAILDAMFYLNMYYKNDFGDSSEFPEQVNCGKFTALYKILQDYYREWSTKDNPDRYMVMVFLFTWTHVASKKYYYSL